MLTIEFASNPAYATSDNSIISLDVKFAEFGEILPFGASAHDPMPYGVELYERALTGEFGAIAPFVAIPEDQPTTTGAQTL